MLACYCYRCYRLLLSPLVTIKGSTMGVVDDVTYLPLFYIIREKIKGIRVSRLCVCRKIRNMQNCGNKVTKPAKHRG